MSRFDWLELGELPAPAAPEPQYTPPSDAAGFCRTARKLREAGHFKAAADYYARAIGLNEHDHAATVELIDTLTRAGLLERAEAVSGDVSANYRQVPLYYAARALVLAHRGALEEAWRLSLTASEHTPHWYAAFVRAELLLRASPDNLPEVVQQLDALTTDFPQLWELHFLGGWILLEANFPAQAAALAAESAHLHPRSAASWLLLGDCFHALRLYDQAMFYYQRVTGLESGHALALARQRACSGLRFGLMRLFRATDLRKRWTKAYDNAASATQD